MRLLIVIGPVCPTAKATGWVGGLLLRCLGE